jgi:carboxylate-amine ligase
MSITFNPSPTPTLGVELELQLVDRKTRQLTPLGPEVLRALDGNPHVKPELLQSTLELNTGVCDNVQEIKRDLETALAEVRPVCESLGCELLSAGTHPFSTWPGQAISEQARYRDLVERVQWPAQRLMIFGLHVHVGMDSAEKSVAVFNALTGCIPQLLALSASSPFWQGNDTGLASVRSKVFETLPTAGLPETLVNWGEFQNFMNTLITAGAIESIREVWWDIRPHPGFGTVELRVCDGLPTMDELLSVVAFTHCATVWLSREYEEGRLQPLDRHWVISENKWRAARWGLEAQMILDDHGTQMRNGERIAEMLAKLRPLGETLNCADELAGVESILEHGPSYLRQRKIHKQTGRLEAVVDALIEEWRTNQRIDSV